MVERSTKYIRADLCATAGDADNGALDYLGKFIDSVLNTSDAVYTVGSARAAFQTIRRLLGGAK